MPVALNNAALWFSLGVGEWSVTDGSATKIAGLSLNHTIGIADDQWACDEHMQHSQSGLKYRQHISLPVFGGRARGGDVGRRVQRCHRHAIQHGGARVDW